MNMPDDLTELPAGGIFTLTCDTCVNATDLQRFMDAGGMIVNERYKLFINDPTMIIAKNVERMAAGVHPDGNGGSGDGVILPAATRVPLRELKTGDLVYRVIEVDPPPDARGLHTWKATAIIVAHASDRQIKLKTPLPGHGGTVFQPSALGQNFFETPLQAIQFFLTARRLEIETLEHRRKEAERAIAWATGQPGMVP